MILLSDFENGTVIAGAAAECGAVQDAASVHNQAGLNAAIRHAVAGFTTECVQHGKSPAAGGVIRRAELEHRAAAGPGLAGGVAALGGYAVKRPGNIGDEGAGDAATVGAAGEAVKQGMAPG